MYVSSRVDIFDMIDIDLFTIVALNMMVLKLGCTDSSVGGVKTQSGIHLGVIDSQTESLQGVFESCCGKELGVTESQIGSLMVSLDSCQVNNNIFLVLFAAMLPACSSVISSNVTLNRSALR
nr:hypothetical protein [Tanacetum cinerariifolium]